MYGIVSLPDPFMKLYTSTLKIALPCPQAAMNTRRVAARAFMSRPLIDRDRRRHRDGALRGECIAVREETDVEADRAEAQAPAPAELHLFALITGDAAADRKGAGALLDANVDRRAAPAVHNIASHDRPRPHPQRGIGDVGDRQLGLLLHMIRVDSGTQRIASREVLHALHFDIRPCQLGADVIRSCADFERTR